MKFALAATSVRPILQQGRARMNKLVRSATFFGAIIAIMLSMSSANAQASRTWVSGVGDDANPCSRTAPCKTWAGAISKTAWWGELDALDPGGFGAVTITKSITLDGSGTFASILASLVNGIIINVAATDVVTIRGLSINGFCNGISGIKITNTMPKAVNVEDCVIFRFSTGRGIDWATNAGTLGRLNVRNTVVRDNTGDAVGLSTGLGQVKATFTNCSFLGSANGVHAMANSRATGDHCQFSGNS